MKIVQVTPRLHPAVGGLEKHVYLLSKELVRKGHEVTIYTTTSLTSEDILQPSINPPFITRRKQPAQLPREEVSNGLLVKRLYPLFRFWSLLLVPELPLRLFKEDADIFHIHGYQPFTSICGALGVKTRNRKNRIVLTTHDVQIAESLPHYSHALLYLYDKSLGKLLVKLSDGIIVLNEADLKSLIEMGTEPKKLACIPNGIDSEFFNRQRMKPDDLKEFKEKYGLKEQVVLFVGRLERRKRIDLLLAAFKRAISDLNDSSLLIVGPDYGELQHLKECAFKLGLSNNIIFTGVLSDKELFTAYATADILVSTSEQEAFGITLIEAMAMEVPVVASAWKGMKYVVRHKENGFLFKPGDVCALTRYISFILNDSGLRRKLGKNGRVCVEERFSIKKMADAVERFYFGVIS